MDHAAMLWRAEEAGINGFPALRQVLSAGWLLRFSNGLVRRTANSATPLLADPGAFETPGVFETPGAFETPGVFETPGAFETVVAGAAMLYRRQGQPAIFRIPSFLPPDIDAQLAELGYSREGESCVIYSAIGGIDAAADPEVRLDPRPRPDWLVAMARLQGRTAEQSVVYSRIVEAIVLPAAFASLSVNGEAAALAYGVIHNGLLCFESVVTAPGQQRRGFARRVLGALAAWGRDNGASGACLQVEAPNAPARALYARFGLTAELYRYHYRRQPSSVGF